MKAIKRKIIKIYQKDSGDCPFIAWIESLDATIRHRIKSRLANIATGNLGVFRILSDGVSKLKFKFGSGYRIYYNQPDEGSVLLLCGGDKKTQRKDIKLAKEYLKDYLGEYHG